MSPQAAFGILRGDIGRKTFTPDYGDRSDASPASSSFTVAKQTYQWASYTLDNGHTITLATAYKPSIFRCQGTLTINGAINGDGLGHAGGAAYGGKGAGPGGGGGGATGSGGAVGGGGGGGGHGANGTSGGANSFGYPVGLGGNAYGGSLDDLLGGTFNDHCAGSGGGGGGWDLAGSGAPGAGGAGGAGLILIARRVVLGTTASITLDGANGGAGGNNNAGGGGGGSGGLLAIFADIIELPGAGTIITATAGSGGAASTSGTAGGNGAVGRIYLVYLRSISPSDATSRSSPAATAISLKAPVNIG